MIISYKNNFAYVLIPHLTELVTVCGLSSFSRADGRGNPGDESRTVWLLASICWDRDLAWLRPQLSAIGAAILGNFGQGMGLRAQLSLIGSVGMAASLIILSLCTQQLWAALLVITCLGVFAAMAGVPIQTTIQAQTPEAMRGKVFGLQNNAVNIALSLP
ncbi:MAG: hypothetical protein GDA43_15225 [Hormoscilla sp. SP5CHS1]|nr:hypothetical protein [Hormoscilla sp. SP5CHS1]